MKNKDKYLNYFDQEPRDKCPQCGGDNIGLPLSDEENFAFLLLRNDGTFTIPPRNIPVLLTICNDCGLISTWSKSIIDKNLETDSEQS